MEAANKSTAIEANIKATENDINAKKVCCYKSRGSGSVAEECMSSESWTRPMRSCSRFKRRFESLKKPTRESDKRLKT